MSGLTCSTYQAQKSPESFCKMRAGFCSNHVAEDRMYDVIIFLSARRIISPSVDGETFRAFDSCVSPLRLGYSKNPEANAYSITPRWCGVSLSASEIRETRNISAVISRLLSLFKSLRNELLAVMASTQSVVPSGLLGDESGQVKQKQFTSAIALHIVESLVTTTPRIRPRLVLTM